MQSHRSKLRAFKMSDIALASTCIDENAGFLIAWLKLQMTNGEKKCFVIMNLF